MRLLSSSGSRSERSARARRPCPIGGRPQIRCLRVRLGLFLVTRLVVLLAVACLATGSTAQAQSIGAGHGQRNQDDGQTPGASSATGPVTPAKPPPPPKPVSASEIVGVVKAVDPEANQITIAYEAVEARNWPPGTMPFTAYKSSVLKDVTVGEKVRFKLDGQQITDISPF
jgi:hypothetical protein